MIEMHYRMTSVCCWKRMINIVLILLSRQIF